MCGFQTQLTAKIKTTKISETRIRACFVKTCTVKITNHMWQSQVEIEHYSVAYFNCITAFEAL